MSIAMQAGFGAAVLFLGWLLARWASRYDVRSWLTDALWRIVWRVFRRGEWRKMREMSIDVVDSDPLLKQQISRKVAEVRADAQRMGTVRTTIKHGGLHAMAYAVNFLAGPILLVGLAIIAHAAWRWLA